MSLASLGLTYLNQYLRYANLQIETLTAKKAELSRLRDLERADHFARPIFPIHRVLKAKSYETVIEPLKLYQARFSTFEDPSRNDVEYTYNNHLYTSPDAEVLYALIRQFQPPTVVEVGCGNSTKIIRQAIMDGKLTTRLISIDPQPRVDISGLIDELYRSPVQDIKDTSLFRSLKAGDLLFIDSSHEVRIGNDVVFLYLKVIPELPPGVLIHIHDIFLPYDYPKEWMIDNQTTFGRWNEQYLVDALLTSNLFEILWAGYFFQKTQSDFAKHFPYLGTQMAKSLWLRKLK